MASGSTLKRAAYSALKFSKTTPSPLWQTPLLPQRQTIFSVIFLFDSYSMFSLKNSLLRSSPQAARKLLGGCWQVSKIYNSGSLPWVRFPWMVLLDFIIHTPSQHGSLCSSKPRVSGPCTRLSLCRLSMLSA